MRTEDELRAALTALERHAPAAARVLPGSESRRSGHGLRSPRTIRLLSGAVTAAALAGVVTALTLPGGTAGKGQNGGVAASAPIAGTTLQAKLLAAFSTTGNEIVYIHETAQSTGVPYTDPSPLTQESWYYPGQPSTGQQVRSRSILIQPGWGHLDTGVSYLQPAPASCPAPGRGVVKGEQVNVDYSTRTWSDVKDTQVISGSPFNQELIAHIFKSGQWTAINTTLNGQQAIELTLTEVDRNGKVTVHSGNEHLWVDASTYLPLHFVASGGSPGMTTRAVEDFQYLPPTPANLAKLAPPIPSGFKQVAGPQTPMLGSGPCFGSSNRSKQVPATTVTASPSPDLGHQRSRG